MTKTDLKNILLKILIISTSSINLLPLEVSWHGSENLREKPIKNVFLVEDSNSLEKVKSNLVALGRKENYL